MARRTTHPTVVLHAGELARGAATRLTTSASPAVDESLAVFDLDGSDPEGGGERLQARLDRLLSLPALIAASRAGRPAPASPRLHAFVVADLAEAGTAGAVRSGLGALLELVRGRYAPIFRSYLDDAQAAFSCNPVLVLPGPSEPWPEGARELLEHLEALHREPAAPPPVSNVFVVGCTSGRYLLDRNELGGMIATFLDLLIFGGLDRAPGLERLLARGRDPYATFVSATLEVDEAAVRRYCALETAAELLGWVGRTSARRTEVADRAPEVAELFDVGRYRALVPLEQGQRALDQVIDSQCPDFASAFRDVGLFEDARPILGHYDPAWHRTQRRRIEAAERELSLFRIEEVIDEVEVNGVALAEEERARIDRFIDGRLADPAEGNLADAALTLGHLRKRLAAERAALADAATAPLARSPSLDRFDRAYRDGLCHAAAAKPRRSRLVLWGLLAWCVGTVASALLLRHLVPLLGLAPDSGLRAVLTPPWAWGTAAAATAVLLATTLLLRLYQTTAEIRRWVGHRGRHGELRVILEDLSRGPASSLAAFYGSRFRRACDIWVYRTLLSVLKHIDDRLARLTEMLRVLDEQQREARRLQRQLGASLAPGDERSSGPLLRRPMVGPELLSGVAQTRREPRELEAVAAAFCREVHPFDRWTEAMPLADLEALVRACERFYGDVAETSALLQPDLAPDARQRLGRFIVELGGRLDFHLDFAGQLFQDGDDIDRSLAEVVVVGDEAAELVAEHLARAGAEQWQLLDSGERPANRVCLLKLVTGIAPEAIRWHRRDEASGGTEVGS